MENSRIKEKDLVEPVLSLIAQFGDEQRGLDVTRIDELLRQMMKLSKSDREILKGRKDDRFSQVVRNLVSHRTLERKGFAEYRTSSVYRRGAYFLTPKGAAMLNVTIDNQQLNLFD